MLQRYAGILLESNFFTHHGGIGPGYRKGVFEAVSKREKTYEDLWFMWNPSDELGFDVFCCWVIDWSFPPWDSLCHSITNHWGKSLKALFFQASEADLSQYLLRISIRPRYLENMFAGLSLDCPTIQLQTNIFFLNEYPTVGGSLAILPFFP